MSVDIFWPNCKQADIFGKTCPRVSARKSRKPLITREIKGGKDPRNREACHSIPSFTPCLRSKLQKYFLTRKSSETHQENDNGNPHKLKPAPGGHITFFLIWFFIFIVCYENTIFLCGYSPLILGQ
jgi:hypothetical protein